MNLSKRVKISQAVTVTAGAAGATDILGATHDMQGYDGIMYVAQVGAIVATAVSGLRAQQGAASDMSDAADLLGSAISIADDADNTTYYIDIWKPSERYQRLVVDRATANLTITAVAIQYAAKKYPTTHQATVVVGESHTSPAEGTA
jgi:hypothetical protein